MNARPYRPELPGLDASPAAVRARIEWLEHKLERLWTLPGTKRQVGLDVALDLIPGIGPVVATALGSYIAWEARNLGLPKRQVARMAGNIGIDFLLGAIPFVGAIPDYFFRSNSRNLRILKKHLDRHHPATRTIEARAL